MASANVIQFDFLEVPALSCAWEGIGFKDKLLVYTLGPLVLCLLLFFPVVYVLILGSWKKWETNYSVRYQKSLDAFYNNVLFALFLVYPASSLTVLQTFHCQDLKEGYGNLLIADYRVTCPNDHPTSFLFIFGVVNVFLWPIGVPIFMYLLMRSFKVHDLADTKFGKSLVSAMMAAFVKQTNTLVSVRVAQEIGNPHEQMEFEGRVERLYAASPNLQDFAMKLLERVSGLNEDNKKETIELIQSYDTDGDGQISFPEFLAMVKDLTHSCTLFTGNEELEHLSADQCIALLTHPWSEFREGPSDVSNSNFAIVVEQLDRIRKRSSLQTSSFRDKLQQEEQEEAEVKDRELQKFRKDLLGRSPAELKELVVIKARKLWQGQVISAPPILWDPQVPEEAQAIDRCGFLFAAYEVRYYWWESTEMVRKLLMTSILTTYIYDGEPAQPGAGLLITFVFLHVHHQVRPFITEGLNSLQAYTLAAQLLTLFVGLMIVATESSEQATSDNEYSRFIVAVTIVLVNGTTLVFPLLRMVWTGKHQEYSEKFASCFSAISKLFGAGGKPDATQKMSKLPSESTQPFPHHYLKDHRTQSGDSPAWSGGRNKVDLDTVGRTEVWPNVLPQSSLPNAGILHSAPTAVDEHEENTQAAQQTGIPAQMEMAFVDTMLGARVQPTLPSATLGTEIPAAFAQSPAVDTPEVTPTLLARANASAEVGFPKHLTDIAGRGRS
eukprot:CAMPEP_0184309058 /NCGR_PEP_ID=MMETSP1049-20130417/17339_1 /TAXON_ID=77928 /ORGANISM="Proteomonas sulcata, Strain CCMP704" /LENGTH=721 /DNA_ID=CAMNT_0026621875 /DNA_START=176 /DNA_END=2341 /DNA_ORIENTATION=+